LPSLCADDATHYFEPWRAQIVLPGDSETKAGVSRPMAALDRYRLVSYNVENMFRYRGVMKYIRGSGDERVRFIDEEPKPE
jgi:hypothetical protein